MSQSRQLATIMFTDIVGYTALMGEDEEKAFQILKKNRQIQRPIIEKYNGRWLKEIGDGTLASFYTVSEAVYCAKEIQEAGLSEPDLNLRIGIHLGEVVFEDNDVFGDGVNIASRLESIAPAGGILVSESVHRNLINKKDIRSTFHCEETLRHVKEPVRVYSITVEEQDSIPLSEKPVQPIESTKFRKPGKGILVVLAVPILFSLGYFFYENLNTTESPTEENTVVLDKSIVVLPFANMSSDPEQEYFSDGMMEEILNQLAKIKDLKVISRTTSMKFKGTTKSIKEITEELDVATALEGSVRKDGDQIRITVQLIEGSTDTHLWSETYDRELVDIFEVQSDVARLIASVLKSTVSPETLIRMEPQPVKNAEAYRLMLEANYISRQPGSAKKQRELMEQAVALDSTNARIWAGLAKAYSRWGGDYTLRAERALKAREAAEKAILIDPEEPNGHFELGRILILFYWEWDKAAKELEKAEALSSIHKGASLLLYRALGIWDKSFDAGTQLLNLNPVNPNTWRMVGRLYLLAGLPDQAIEYIDKSLELDPNYHLAWVDLGWAYLELNETDKAFEALNQASERNSERLISYLIYACYQKGMIPEMNVYMAQLMEKDQEDDNSIYLARTFAMLNEADSCFEWLQKAFDRKNPELHLIKTAQFKHIQNLQDPRYNELLREMNLPES